jgi:hypothetical protein
MSNSLFRCFFQGQIGFFEMLRARKDSHCFLLQRVGRHEFLARVGTDLRFMFECAPLLLRELASKYGVLVTLETRKRFPYMKLAVMF